MGSAQCTGAVVRAWKGFGLGARARLRRAGVRIRCLLLRGCDTGNHKVVRNIKTSDNGLW